MNSTKKLINDKGFLLFSVNTKTIDYSKIVKQCVKHLKFHMPDIPVAVCGQHCYEADVNIPLSTIVKNQRRYIHKHEVVYEDWKNLTRHLSLELTPFETTILLDSDYFVLTNQLEMLFYINSPIMMFDSLYNIKENENMHDLLGKSNIVQKWATVLKFNHSKLSNKFFSYWQQVIQHYKYYSYLYQWTVDNTIWNDKAVTIAHQQMCDFDVHSKQYTIPWQHNFANFMMEPISVNYNEVILQDSNSRVVFNQDCHILNKHTLVKIL